MMTMIWPRVLELPWREEVASWFDSVCDLPYPVWLDSGGSGYGIIAAAPVSLQRIDSGRAEEVEPALRSLLGDSQAPPDDLPFSGGIIGYLGYELGREWIGLGPGQTVSLPIAAFGVYDWALLIDPLRKRVSLVSQGRYAQTRGLWDELCHRLRHPPGPMERAETRTGTLTGNSLDREAYGKAFGQVQGYLVDGDIYQVNLTRCFEARSTEGAWSLYRRLRGISPAPYGAFMDFGEFQLLSNSPEQFVSLRAGQVSTRPIKGTRPRSSDPTLDAQSRADLVASDKDRAENLMIVDLLRNDLGRVCTPGSIEVPKLFAVESFATVHHLVSTVSGVLRPGQDAVDLLRACFPGGSVTGAPKRRAMQIIDEIEPVSREAYCGSIFYLGYDGCMDSNITIRTLIKEGDRLRYWAGGGIVADSQVDTEYRETLDKARAFLDLLGQLEPLCNS